MKGRLPEIWWSFAAVTLPMLLFSAVLLGLVFTYRVRHDSIIDTRLALSDIQDEPGVVYVDMSATILVFIASWSSTLAPLLGGFLMTLASYPMARGYMTAVDKDLRQSLLTPYQLALTLKFLAGGSLGALWNWLVYIVNGKQKPCHGRPLRVVVAFSTLTIGLGFLVLGADTWLHVTTTTVPFTTAYQVTSDAAYSFGLAPSCLDGNNSFVEPCSINPGGTQIFLTNGSTTLQVLNNVSSFMTVLPYEQGGSSYSYIGVPPSPANANRDFSATTIGLSTQCAPISSACNLLARAGSSTPFSCTDAFQGDLTQDADQLITAYVTDATFINNNTIRGVNNPFFFGIAAISNSEGGGDLVRKNSTTTFPEIVTPTHGGIAFVLNCSTTVFDITYTWVNGTIRTFTPHPSNTSTTNACQAPMAYTTFANTILQQAASLATFSSSAQQLADKLSTAYSAIALAGAAGALEPRAALVAQQRTARLVARVPLAPLATLVAANLVFVVLGVALAAYALAASSDEVRDVQARLSVEGLVADRFEARVRHDVDGVEKLFAENRGAAGVGARVRIARSEGRGGEFAYDVLRADGGALGEAEGEDVKNLAARVRPVVAGRDGSRGS